jgi:hypothetical protein
MIVVVVMGRRTPQFGPSVRMAVGKKAVTSAVRSLLWFEWSRLVNYGKPKCQNHSVEHVIGKVGNLSVRNLQRNVAIAQVVSGAQQSKWVR